MCKNSENGAKLPTSRKSPRAMHAGVRNSLLFDFASLPKRWPVVRQRHGPIAREPGGMPVAFDGGPSQMLLDSWVQFSGPTSWLAFGRVNASLVIYRLVSAEISPASVAFQLQASVDSRYPVLPAALSAMYQGSHASWKVVESSGFLFVIFPGPEKSWKMGLVLESTGNFSGRSWKVLEFYRPWRVRRTQWCRCRCQNLRKLAQILSVYTKKPW